MKFKSIQSKMLVFIISHLALLALCMGTTSMISLSRMSKKDSQSLMSSSCKEKLVVLDCQLSLVEHAVNSIADFAQDLIEDPDVLKDSLSRRNYMQQMEKFSVELAESTEGSLSVYYHLSPEVTNNGTEGFYFIRKNLSADYVEIRATNLLKYDRDDFDYVGWYYIPVDRGEGTWIDPYKNKSLEKEIISYVVPIYRDELIIGVAGMDIDLQVFLKLGQVENLYNDSEIYMTNSSATELYSIDNNSDDRPLIEPAAKSFRKIFEEYRNCHFVQISKASLKEKNYSLTFGILGNGMKYLLLCPRKEIVAQQNRLLGFSIATTIIFLAIATGASILGTRSVTKPIKQLSYAANEYAKGNWDFAIECSTNDEIKSLTDNIMFMASKTKKYIDVLNRQALIDGLTGAKNKLCYKNFIHLLINSPEMEPYTIVMFDVNGLKSINDEYGHEAGDKLIIRSYQTVCKIFTHSPVFRIGGDEFVTILQNEDFRKQEKLFEQFERAQIIYSDIVPGKDIPISIAYGSATKNGQIITYDELFDEADKKMYEKKTKMKSGY